MIIWRYLPVIRFQVNKYTWSSGCMFISAVSVISNGVSNSVMGLSIMSARSFIRCSVFCCWGHACSSIIRHEIFISIFPAIFRPPGGLARGPGIRLSLLLLVSPLSRCREFPTTFALSRPAPGLAYG